MSKVPCFIHVWVPRIVMLDATGTSLRHGMISYKLCIKCRKVLM